MKLKKYTASRCAIVLQREKDFRDRKNGIFSGSFGVSNARQGGKGALSQYGQRVPAGSCEISVIRAKPQNRAGGGRPRRPGGFSRRFVPAKAGEQERGAQSGDAAEFLP